MSAGSEGMSVSLAKIEDAVDQLISSIGWERIPAYDEPSTDLKNKLFDYHLKALQTTMRVAKKNLWTKIRDIRRERNATQPIFRLPNELLVAILLEATLHDGGGWGYSLRLIDHYADLDRYCDVHPLWRTVIENTPKFWTILCNWHTDEQIDRALTLSKAASLDISLIAIDDKLKGFLQRILPHVSRWRRWFSTGVTSEAPSLEQITLMGSFDLPARKKLFILSHGAARLHTVHLARIVVPYTAPWLRNLKNLRIDLPCNTGYTPSRLLDMLRDNFTLRSLTLVDFDCIIVDQSPISGSIILPCLEYLEVSTARCADTGVILAAIKAPSCSELNIRWHSSTEQGSMASSLQSWESIFKLKLLGEATLELRDHIFVKMLHFRTLPFTFTLTTNDISECAHWVFSQFLLERSVKVTHLTERSDNNRLVALIYKLPRYMKDIHTLEYMVDWAPSSNTSPIHECLQEPHRTDHGTEWLLPNLCIIKNTRGRLQGGRAEWMDGARNDGRSFIEKRWGKGAAPWTSEGIKPPAALEDIVFPRFHSIKHLIQSPDTLPAAEDQP